MHPCFYGDQKVCLSEAVLHGNVLAASCLAHVLDASCLAHVLDAYFCPAHVLDMEGSWLLHQAVIFLSLLSESLTWFLIVLNLKGIIIFGQDGPER